MDVNATLAKIRELAADTPLDDEDAQELAEAFRDLDEWIMRGGDLPSEWAARQVRPITQLR